MMFRFTAPSVERENIIGIERDRFSRSHFLRADFVDARAWPSPALLVEGVRSVGSGSAGRARRAHAF
jgi:hypothetical protein